MNYVFLFLLNQISNILTIKEASFSALPKNLKFCIKVNPLNLEFLNQAKNVPVVRRFD